MKEEIEIEARYRKADADERLYLFLQFPELRISFQEIDLEEYAANRDYIGVFDQASITREGSFYCETSIPKAQRSGIGKLNNPRAKRSGINDTHARMIKGQKKFLLTL